jgi:protocatechuate 3,4-dioxygenase beta subunit
MAQMTINKGLSRRGFLFAGAVAACYGAAPGDPNCILVAEQETGPYYVDGPKLRQDITEGKPGLPLKLRIALVDSRKCEPLSNAAVDIWHCDAAGVYSGFTASNPDGPPGGFGGPGGRRGPGRGPGGPPPGFPPDGPPPDFGPGRGPGGRGRQIDATRFLRGVQLTGKDGLVEFATLYPGWYAGRTIHIHLKVHIGGSEQGEIYGGGHVSHTGQLFFPEDITAEVARLQPYAKRLDIHRTTQEEDGIFRGQHGSATILTLDRLKKGTNESGFLATITLAVDPEAIPTPIGMGGRGPRGG